MWNLIYIYWIFLYQAFRKIIEKREQRKKDKFYKNGENIQGKDNFEFKFGIIEENNLMKDRIFSLNMEKNLEKVKISEYIFLNENGIEVENREGKILENYLWDEISKITVENFKNKILQIIKKINPHYQVRYT